MIDDNIIKETNFEQFESTMRAILEDYDVLPFRKIKENQCSKN